MGGGRPNAVSRRRIRLSTAPLSSRACWNSTSAPGSGASSSRAASASWIKRRMRRERSPGFARRFGRGEGPVEVRDLRSGLVVRRFRPRTCADRGRRALPRMPHREVGTGAGRGHVLSQRIGRPSKEARFWVGFAAVAVDIQSLIQQKRAFQYVREVISARNQFPYDGSLRIMQQVCQARG